jgi:hypothetical protein
MDARSCHTPMDDRESSGELFRSLRARARGRPAEFGRTRRGGAVDQRDRSRGPYDRRSTGMLSAG